MKCIQYNVIVFLTEKYSREAIGKILFFRLKTFYLVLHISVRLQHSISMTVLCCFSSLSGTSNKYLKNTSFNTCNTSNLAKFMLGAAPYVIAALLSELIKIIIITGIHPGTMYNPEFNKRKNKVDNITNRSFKSAERNLFIKFFKREYLLLKINFVLLQI